MHMKKISLNKNKQKTKRKKIPNSRKPLKKSQYQNNINSKSKKFSLTPKTIFLTIIAIFIIMGLTFAIARWQNHIDNSYTTDGEQKSDTCVDILNPECWTEALKPKLKETEGKTNVLVVGIDTRESGSGAGLRNTDTMILGTYYHETKKMRMISFPRDLYAPYGCPGLENLPYKSKINAIYAYGENYCNDGDGMKTLSQTIERITGENIHYTILIKLEGVIEAIDKIGGITINVDEDYTDIYPFIELPQELQQKCNRSSQKTAYCIFEFKKGEHQLDGQMALIYSRMRYWSSDFDRARRQQQVISAIKDKVVGEDIDFKTKIDNLLNVYNTLTKYIEVSELNAEMIAAGLDLAKNLEYDPIKVVLDPQFGGGGIIVNGSGSNYNFSDYSFSNVQEKLKFINDNAELYNEHPKIYAVNKTGLAWAQDNPILVLKNSNLWFLEIITDTKPKQAEKSGVEIIDFSENKMERSVERLKSDFMKKNIQVKVIDGSIDETLSPTPAYKEDIRVEIYSLESSTPQDTVIENSEEVDNSGI